jgi:hypothetical protein
MTETPATLSPWELRDPEMLIHEIAERVPLAEDHAYAALVRAPSTRAELVDVRPLALPALLDDEDDISDELARLAQSWQLPDVRPPQHLVATILVRPGRCVLGPNEGVWLRGWRYANHVAPVFDSDLFVVTDHGWTHFPSSWAGHTPRTASDSQPPSPGG